MQILELYRGPVFVFASSPGKAAASQRLAFGLGCWETTCNRKAFLPCEVVKVVAVYTREAYPHEVLLSCLLSPSVLLFSRLPSRTSAPFFCGLWSWIFWRYLITFTLCSSRGQLIRKRPDSCQCHVDVTGGEKGFICVLSCFPPFASSGYS